MAAMADDPLPPQSHARPLEERQAKGRALRDSCARAKQGEVLKRMHEIEEKLKNARLVEDLQLNTDEARIGATVTLKDDDGDDYEYTLVGPDEADPMKGTISVMSPLAQAILGARKGQEVTANLPAGKRNFKVVKVAYK